MSRVDGIVSDGSASTSFRGRAVAALSVGEGAKLEEFGPELRIELAEELPQVVQR